MLNKDINKKIEFIPPNKDSPIFFSLINNKIINKKEISFNMIDLTENYNKNHKIEKYMQLPKYINRSEKKRTIK